MVVGYGGSCVESFETVPFMFCNIDGKCTYASRTGISYWLSTGLPNNDMPIGGIEQVRYSSNIILNANF